MTCIPAVYREAAQMGWRELEIVGEHRKSGRLILREVGVALPGVWLGERGSVRLLGPVFEVRE